MEPYLEGTLTFEERKGSWLACIHSCSSHGVSNFIDKCNLRLCTFHFLSFFFPILYAFWCWNLTLENALSVLCKRDSKKWVGFFNERGRANPFPKNLLKFVSDVVTCRMQQQITNSAWQGNRSANEPTYCTCGSQLCYVIIARLVGLYSVSGCWHARSCAR